MGNDEPYEPYERKGNIKSHMNKVKNISMCVLVWEIMQKNRPCSVFLNSWGIPQPMLKSWDILKKSSFIKVMEQSFKKLSFVGHSILRIQGTQGTQGR